MTLRAARDMPSNDVKSENTLQRQPRFNTWVQLRAESPTCQRDGAVVGPKDAALETKDDDDSGGREGHVNARDAEFQAFDSNPDGRDANAVKPNDDADSLDVKTFATNRNTCNRDASADADGAAPNDCDDDA
jgi:hypothetical protein